MLILQTVTKHTSMSFLEKLFGSKKKGEAPSPQEAIQRLREVQEMLQKKSDFLEKKVDHETQTAKKAGTKNKRGRYDVRNIEFPYNRVCLLLLVRLGEKIKGISKANTCCCMYCCCCA